MGRCEYQCGFSHLFASWPHSLGEEEVSHMEKVLQTERIHRWATVSQSDTQACRQMCAPIPSTIHTHTPDHQAQTGYLVRASTSCFLMALAPVACSGSQNTQALVLSFTH